jgi:hypothetical protein
MENSNDRDMQSASDSYSDEDDDIEVDDHTASNCSTISATSISPQKLSSYLPSQNISIELFENIFQEVIMIITDYAEYLTVSTAANASKDILNYVSTRLSNPRNVFIEAMKLVVLISRSEHRSLLTPYFYRVFIAKAGIRAKLSAMAFLKRYSLSIIISLVIHFTAILVS